MDKQLIERLAREAGFEVMASGTILLFGEDVAQEDRLQHFAALVASECARIVSQCGEDPAFGEHGMVAAERVAAEIRAKFPPFLAGLRVVADPNMPPGTMVVYGADGQRVTLTGIGEE